VAIYEYYCPTCRDRFEERRPMTQASAPAVCRSGHKAERTISAFAVARGESGPFEMEAPAAGGCCGGGGCACGSRN
jgi:putative FmdB family regulatory protein